MLVTLAAINYVLLVPIAIFCAVFCVAWLLLDMSTKKADIAEQRLDMLSDPNARRSKSKSEMKTGGEAVARAFEGVARLWLNR